MRNFYKLTNTQRREDKKSTGPYPWVAEAVEMKNLSNREICKSEDFLLDLKLEG